MKYYRVAGLLLFLLYSTITLASNSGYGSIKLINPTYNGALLFYHDGARTGEIPVCAQNSSTRWTIDTTLPGGSAQASALLTAYSLNKKIHVVGMGNCDIWGDTETVKWFVIQD